MRRVLFAGLIVVAVGSTSGCVDAEKSSHPLAPTVAGPIPGVSITAPSPMQPVNTKVAVDQQPLTLMIGNSATNGVRPLSYEFDIAIDNKFANTVFSQKGVAPGTSGQTGLRLSDALATGHTYYWRAQAQDGANSSAYSATASFDVYTPIVIQAPVLVSPVGNNTTDSTSPRFTLANAVRSGPVGAIGYTIEVADSDTFANKLAIWTFGETPGSQTSLDAPGVLPANKQLFWHARAFDPTTTGPYSITAVFKTPAPVTIAPPIAGGGAGSALDQINLAQASIVGGGPADVASWAVTTNIQRIDFNPSSGLWLTFPAANTWPDQLIPGWGGGTLQYTVWACVPANGWSCAGFIQMWKGRPGTGAPLPSNYTYWWGPGGGGTAGVFGSYVPQPGDTIAFFVTAGNERGGTYSVIRERSNVVLATLPYGDSGSVSY